MEFGEIRSLLEGRRDAPQMCTHARSVASTLWGRARWGSRRCLRVGWPEEKVTPESGQNRLRVALSTLRTLGLGDAPTYDAEARRYVLQARALPS